MSDKVLIQGLSADAVIGVYDWEREIRQPLQMDLEMAWDCRPAGSSDRLEDALDYAAVAQRLTGFVEQSEFQLIESLAEACAGIVLEEFGVPWVRIALHKPGAVKNAASVGVVITRSRASS
jgi:dihydroneopterin aldolase